MGYVRLKHFDWWLFLAVFFLFCLSLAIIYSIDLGRSGQEFLNFKKQLIFGILGIILMFIAAFSDWRLTRNITWPLYWLGFLLLVGVLFWGEARRATTGWFSFGAINFQPIEAAKIFLILALAAYFSRKAFIPGFALVWQSLVLLSVYLVPVFLQPDLGGALVLGLLWFSLLLLQRLPRKYIFYLLIFGAIVVSLSWGFLLQDYQKDRILVFVNPQHDPLGRGYNVSQSLVAIGSGGLFGQGIGEGTQSQLRFLPEAHTDFIFAVLAEEFGFLGIIFLLLLYLFLLFRIVQISKRVRDNFSLFVLAGVLLVLGIELVLNIGMNLGLLPITGLTLPFVSYGGSSLVSKFILIGIVQSIRLRSF